MPSSVKDRLNTTTEQIFHLTPAPDYWYDLDAIREPHAEASKERIKHGLHQNHPDDSCVGIAKTETDEMGERFCNPAGKNPGDVFEVTTKPFPDAHFAVYPPELCEKPIKATCPPKVCAECGAPYIRSTTLRKPWELEPGQVDRDQLKRAIELADKHDLTVSHYRAIRSVGMQDAGQATEVYDGAGNNTDRKEQLASEAKDALGGYFREFVGEVEIPDGWIQDCDCDTDATEPGICLDPFAGAGTTLLKAKELGRRFVGIELNPEYADMARARIGLTPNDPSRIRDDDGQAGFEAYTD